MKICIPQEVLEEKLQMLKRVIPAQEKDRVWGPKGMEYQRIFMEAKEGTLLLQAGGNDMEAVFKIDCDIEEEGEVLVPADLFVKLVAKFKKEKVYIEENNGKIVIKCGSTEVNLLPFVADNFKFDWEQGTEFGFEIKAEDLIQIIRHVIIAGPNNFSSPYNGVNIKGNGCINFCVLDGHKLALYKYDGMTNWNTIIPIKSFEKLKFILEKSKNETVRVEKLGKCLIFKTKDIFFRTTCLEGSFPAWEKVVKEKDNINVRFITNRIKLLEILERLRTLIQEETEKIVIMQISPSNVFIETQEFEKGYGKEPIFVEDLECNENIKIGMNVDYFIAPLKVLKEEKVRIGIIGSLAPIFVEGVGNENYTYIFMPVRL
ncbi:MAG: DNA polymerase III subunit beta [Thermodesulfovibrio sp.]|nr:DNA polymerase III subunit beta [Thermodesulfovibrio sp.]